MSSSTTTSDSAFTRKRVVRVGAGVASAGVMAGFSLVGATPAMAYTDADCTIANTASVALGYDEVDIQNLLNDPLLPVVCLDGTFVLTTGLTYDRNVTIHGFAGATLDGNNAVRVLEDLGSNFLAIESLHVTGGTAPGDNGGAIDGYRVEVYDSVFDENSANLFGGAISAYGVYVENSLFEENQSTFGGAISGYSFVEALDSTFQHNEAGADGGAINSYGYVELVSSTLFDNEAGGSGGAVFLSALDSGFTSELYVENSTFVENASESDGGAISAVSGTVLQSTFLNNTADDGQAIELNSGEDMDEFATELELRANLFTGTAVVAPQLVNDSGFSNFTDLGGNLFSTSEASETSFTVVETSTRFGFAPSALYATSALGSNGGPTQTVALSDTSPAIDAVPVGEPAVTVDQRGVARSALSDSGAYEHEPVLAATGVVPAGWMGGAAALLLAAGAAAFGFTRRRSIR